MLRPLVLRVTPAKVFSDPFDDAPTGFKVARFLGIKRQELVMKSATLVTVEAGREMRNAICSASGILLSKLTCKIILAIKTMRGFDGA